MYKYNKCFKLLYGYERLNVGSISGLRYLKIMPIINKYLSIIRQEIKYKYRRGTKITIFRLLYCHEETALAPRSSLV